MLKKTLKFLCQNYVQFYIELHYIIFFSILGLLKVTTMTFEHTKAHCDQITSVPKKIDPLEKVKNTRKIEDSIAGKRKLSKYTIAIQSFLRQKFVSIY